MIRRGILFRISFQTIAESRAIKPAEHEDTALTVHKILMEMWKLSVFSVSIGRTMDKDSAQERCISISVISPVASSLFFMIALYAFRLLSSAGSELL